MENSPSIEVTEAGPVVILKLRNTGKLNAITEGMAGELIAAIEKYEKDDRYRVMLLGGADRNFCSGADITGFANRNTEDALRFHLVLNRVVRTIRSCPKPVLAVLEGYSLGGGLEIAESTDIRIASASAKIGQPEINIGINAGAGGNVILPRLVGRGNAMYLILTGRRISAPEALRMGLVDLVFPDDQLWDEAMKIAMEISSKPVVTVQMAKMAVNNSEDMSVSAALDMEASAFAMLFSTAETKDRIRKFMERERN